MSTLTKTHTASIAKPATLAAKPVGKLTLKSMLIVDTGDGAFTDASIKIKAHHTDKSLQVWKCTDSKRLAKGLADAGLAAVKLIKGNKHFIAVVRIADVAAVLGTSMTPTATLTGVKPGKFLQK